MDIKTSRLQAVLVAILLFASCQWAKASVNIGGIYYDLNEADHTAKMAYTPNLTGHIVLPKHVTYDEEVYTLISIGYMAFYQCNVTSVTIPSSVTFMEDGVFYQCSNLKSAKIPFGVTSIGKWTFEGCSSLISVSIPSSVTTIGGRAFKDCSSLTSVDIPESVTSIGSSAFEGCI